MAKIEGSANTKALVLLSHYDSAPHSYSNGASDDASGVATILETVRAFLHNKTKHKNDIIILFSDAEELALNGAALFVTKHNWAKKVGLVPGQEGVTCHLGDGSALPLPAFLGRFIRPADAIRVLPAEGLIIER